MIFISAHANDYRLPNLCGALSISRRTYYRHRGKEDPDHRDYELIKHVFDESKGTYGYRRVQEGSGANSGSCSTTRRSKGS